MFFVYQISAYSYELKTDTVAIKQGNCQINQLVVTIVNTESEYLWFWFDGQNNNREDAYVIRQHLMKRDGDFSLFDIATHANMDGCLWCVPLPMKLFVKCIEPGNSFKILIYKESGVDEIIEIPSIDIKKLFRIYRNEEIVKYCPCIDSKLGIKRISYPYDVIILNENMICLPY